MTNIRYVVLCLQKGKSKKFLHERNCQTVNISPCKSICSLESLSSRICQQYIQFQQHLEYEYYINRVYYYFTYVMLLSQRTGYFCHGDLDDHPGMNNVQTLYCLLFIPTEMKQMFRNIVFIFYSVWHDCAMYCTLVCDKYLCRSSKHNKFYA